MYNYYTYNYPTEDNRPAWRSAGEIEIAARQHENLRLQRLDEEVAPALRFTNPLSFLKNSVALFFNLLG